MLKERPTAARTERPGRENFDRITRVFALFVGVGYIGYFVLLLPPIVALMGRMAPWWTPTMLVIAFVPGLALIVVSRLRDIAVTRAVAAAAALGFFVVVFTWPFAWDGSHIAASEAVWFAAFPGLASLAAVLAWPARIALVHMLIGCVSTQVINYVARGDMEPVMLIPEILFSLMYCMIFVGGAMMALRTGRLLDESTEAIHRAAATTAGNEARAVERERFDALIHDSVLSTLLTASRRGVHDDVPSLAAATLAELDGIKDGGQGDQALEPVRAIIQLRAMAADADTATSFDVRVASADPAVLPAEVVQTVGAAMAEAIRNSARHAGDGARCAVRGTVGPTSVHIEVRDDGDGFEPAKVSSRRLGIAVSIHGRMARLAGGTATVESEPGSGTSVHLDWRQT